MRQSVCLRSGLAGLFRVGAICLTALGSVSIGGATSAMAGPEPRKLPMQFNWVACEPDCRGWVSAVGIITTETPAHFEKFVAQHDLANATVVLDSSGGSVNDAITLGRRWRALGLRTTVGTTVETRTPSGLHASVRPQAYCESMCVFLLLSGTTRFVPPEAKVRVHQIWMGDRAENPRGSTYSAEDLMIVERDIGRLAKYTFEMGGTGDLLQLSLSVAPWDDLHRLTPEELRLSNLPTTDSVDHVLPGTEASQFIAEIAAEPQLAPGGGPNATRQSATGSARLADTAIGPGRDAGMTDAAGLTATTVN